MYHYCGFFELFQEQFFLFISKSEAFIHGKISVILYYTIDFLKFRLGLTVKLRFIKYYAMLAI